MHTTTVLPGQSTLLGSWRALAALSPAARLVDDPAGTAAVFPAWAALNNAIVADAGLRDPAAAGSGLARHYVAAGVPHWALWLPSARTDLDAPDDGPPVPGFARDTSTLVMCARLGSGRAAVHPGDPHHGVRRTSIASATLATDDPVPAAELEPPDGVPGLDGWVLVERGRAVVGAWSYLLGDDCGIYTVGTVPAWRRRGLAAALLRRVLAVAVARGARTATLQSTRMGQPLYAGLGFVPAGRYEEWVPVSGPS